MTKEEIYDSQINPLMAQIINICKENKIAMLCNFRLDEDMQVTSALLDDEYDPSDSQLDAITLLYPRKPTAFAFTITKP
jgi:bisphosphoglycerate-independent phosphoglycerate mutase (AlkP superfamily)